MGDLHSGSGAANKTNIYNSNMHTWLEMDALFVTTYAVLVRPVQVVDLLWVVVGLQRAGC